MPTFRSLLLASTLLALSCVPSSSLTDADNGLDGFDPKADAAATCSVKQNKDGSATIACPDGTTATVLGEQGEKGDKGDKGDTGDTGATGTAGSSCSVLNNGNGTFTMTCTNGTNVTWSSSGTGGTNPYIPDGVLHGSYTIENSLDVAFLNGVTQVTGSLTIKGAGLTSIGFPGLSVGDTLTIGEAPDLMSLSLPQVTNLRGSLVVSSTRISTFTLPVTSVGDNFYVWANPDLTSFTLADLTSVGKNIEIGGNATLSALDLSSLSRVERSTNISSNPALTSFSLPVTWLGDYLEVEDNGALLSLEFPALQKIAGGTYDSQIALNPVLATVSFPALYEVVNEFQLTSNGVSDYSFPSLVTVTNYFGIAQNSLLTSLSLPALTNVGYLQIYHNVNLCESYATSLSTQVAPTTVDITLNKSGC